MDWRIETFGGLRLIQGETVTERFRTQKSALLLAYLASFPRRTYSREAIGEFLWPDEDPEKQRNRLRYELSTLRKLLGVDAIHAPDNSQIALAPPVTSDAAAFEEALRTAAKASSPAEKLPYLEAATALYRGDFLPGFYDDWVSGERDRLRERWGDALIELFTTLDALGLHDGARQAHHDFAEAFPERPLPALRRVPDGGAALRAVAGSAARRFHGREAERETVRMFLAESSPLLTIIGMGGIGKTRLAQEAIGNATEPVPLVALAEIRDGDALLQNIWSALPAGDAPAPETRPAIIAYVAAQPEPTVLLLDNFEQIVGGAQTLAALLSDSPKLRCVVTSQTPLDISGETVLPLLPLPVVNAFALFLDRARAVRPDFAPPDGEAASGANLQAVCDLLEGIPLAIELAAARIAGLGAGEVLSQLRNRLAFLVSPEQTVRERRHASLHAALSWSADLLSVAVRERLGAVSVFRGGFDLAAFRQVCAAPDAELLADLETLCRYSLLSTRFEGERTRWHCLDIVRDFAETLPSISQTNEWRERHATYFAAQGNSNAEKSFGGEWRETYDWLLRERPNVGAAVAFLAEKQDAKTLADLSKMYARFLFSNGFWAECDDLLGVVEAVSPPTGIEAMSILGVRGAMARRRGRDADAERLWNERLRLSDGAGELVTFDTLCDLAGHAIDTKQWAKAEAYLERIASLPRPETDTIYLYVLNARLRFEQGNGAEALRFAEKSLAVSEEIGLETALYRDYYTSVIFRRHGDSQRVLVVLKNALRIAHEARNSFIVARFCALLAEWFEENETWDKAGMAWYTAQKIYGTLGSRQAAKSAGSWLRFRQKIAHDVPLSALMENLSAYSWETATELILEEQT